MCITLNTYIYGWTSKIRPIGTRQPLLDTTMGIIIDTTMEFYNVFNLQVREDLV